MARADIISKLYAKKGSALEFNYDSLMAPPLVSLIPLKDMDYMHKLVTSIRYTSKTDYKESEIKKIMNCYGFVRYTSGTHRVVYRHLDIPTIVAKISLNKTSLGDNLREMYNQQYLRPFCTKVFDVHPSGVIGLFERVEPFQTREEFMSVAGDIFDFINSKIIGKYVVDDIGTASFMNYGIRKVGPYSNISFGPVILDFPEVYPLDGDKLYCNKIENGFVCGGVLDYDEGFNTICCKKCGKLYEARQLQVAIENNEIIKKGETENMKMSIRRNGKIIKTVDSTKMGTDTIQPPRKKKQIDSSSPMDLIGTATGRKHSNKSNVHMVNMSLENYNNSQNEETTSRGAFCGGYRQNNVADPVMTEEIMETESVKDASEPEVPVAVDKTEEETRVYSTDTGFIPKAEELVNDEYSDELGGEAEDDDVVDKAVNDIVSSIFGSSDEESVNPEDELGDEYSDELGECTESVDSDDELGEDVSIDPAALAASMMAGRDHYDHSEYYQDDEEPETESTEENPFLK